MGMRDGLGPAVRLADSLQQSAKDEHPIPCRPGSGRHCSIDRPEGGCHV